MRFSIDFEDATSEHVLQLKRVIFALRDLLSKEIKLHKSARTTAEQRFAIQRSPKIHGIQRMLAKQYGVNPKTIKKWMDRTSIGDAKMGPRRGKFRSHSDEEVAAIIDQCRNKPQSIDKSLADLSIKFPKLTRSTLYRIRRQVMIKTHQEELPSE
jgi:transposase-like protein